MSEGKKGNETALSFPVFDRFRFQSFSRFSEGETKIGASFPVLFPLVSCFSPILGKRETKDQSRRVQRVMDFGDAGRSGHKK